MTQAEIEHSDSLVRAEHKRQAKEATLKRFNEIGIDKVRLSIVATAIDLFLEKHEIPTMHTDEANILVRDLISSIKHRVFLFDNDAKELK